MNDDWETLDSDVEKRSVLRFLMAIDTLAPGYVPFMDFDLSSNFHRHLKVFDEILEYDFDVFVGGHLTHLGSRQEWNRRGDMLSTFTGPPSESMPRPT